MKDIVADDSVRVQEIPEWLLHDLPVPDQQRLQSQKGEVVKVLKVLPNGYLWLAFADGSDGFSLQPTEIEYVQV